MSNYQKQIANTITTGHANKEVHSVAIGYRRSDNQMLHPQLKECNGDNICHRTLLTIVARGIAIITELHRLIELVPAPFKHSEATNNEPLVSRYLDKDKKFTLDDLICDFSYFKAAETFEAKIEANPILKKADEDFCDNFINILTRFYLTFESIQRYATDLNNFILELEEEAFVGQSLDGLLLDTESRQLICEAYFLLGYMLITTDNNFEGGLRERLIVSYYRYSSYKSSPGSSLDDTCNLMRSTGFRSLQQQIYKASSNVHHYRPEGYPETFFNRVGVNQLIVNLLIAKLQSVDIYNQTVMAFPHPDHRSTALAQQASMLYVILYFCPNILNSQRSRMREITDKFFYDNWVISIYMGELVSLVEAWDPYKAARESLGQLLEIESTQTLVNQFNLKFFRVSKQLQEYLREGWLNEDSVLEHHVRILNQLREANVILRWMLLHSQVHPIWQLRLTKTVYSIVINGVPNRKALYKFLQNLSELEKNFSAIYNKILIEKDSRIQDDRTKAVETLNELVEIFNDTKPMRWIQVGANSKLASLLFELSSNLESVKFNQPNGRDMIIKLINEIESAQETYSDGKNLQVVQLFRDTRDSLLQILRSLSLTDDIKILLHSISDFSYAWKIMDDTFTTHMQQIIKDDPHKVYGIEATFLKLASAFDTYLIRIQQVNSQADLISVSQYYSTKLVSYIRDVLHIIPETILELLSAIISIQTECVMGDLPSKVLLDNLKDYALTDKRFKMLELTHKVSHYSESMLMMQDTTIGLIRINSKQLLEDGIRRELVKRMSDSIHDIIQCHESGDSSSNHVRIAENLLAKLNRLDVVMNGYKRSFEYIQDYLFIYGLRMWQEELSRIIKFNVEQATEALFSESCLRSDYQSQMDQQSMYQSSKAPIPVYNSDPLKYSFILKILNELLKITDPRWTIYDEQMSAWYEQKPQRDKVIDLKVFELIASSLSATGLNGIDQLCCSLLMIELQKLDTLLISIVTGKSLQSQYLLEALTSLIHLNDQSNSGENSRQSNRVFASALIKIAPHSERIINHLLRIGQLQAIRTNIGCVLSTKCRYEARNLYNCLETLNTTLLSTIRHGKESSSQHKGSHSSHPVSNDETTTSSLPPDSEREDNLEDSQLIFELTNHLEWIGLSDPLSKVYTLALQTSNSSQVYEFREQLVAMDLMFLILLDQCSKFRFSRSISGFVPKQSRSFYETSYTVDGLPLFYGLTTLTNHYHPFLPATNGELAEQRKLSPLDRLLERMSMYVKHSFNQATNGGGGAIKPHELTLEVVNMTLSMIELIRLARKSSDELLAATYLPKFLFDTFQFTICHLNNTTGAKI